jgi:putative aldouronate transport system permease protein
LIIGLLCFTILYPFWFLFLQSFSTVIEGSSLGFRFWNKTWQATAYKFLFSRSYIFYAYGNSIFRTVLGTFFMLSTSLMIAYPLSKRDLPGRNWITTYFIITMFFAGGLIPFYILIRNLGLFNSIFVYVIPGMVGVFNALLVRNFIMAMGSELEDSALIDGAGYYSILFYIIIPLSKPILATVALWTAVAQWNSWFDCLLYIQSEKKIVLQMIIRRMLTMTIAMKDDIELFQSLIKEGSVDIFTSNVRAAAVFITIGPILLVYPFIQKYFVKGIMMGSLKG